MNNAAHFVPKGKLESKLALIGGSDAHTLLPGFKTRSHRVGEIETPFGLSSPLYYINTEQTGFWFLFRHGEDGYSIAAPFVNYHANIYALKELGVERIIAWSGPGAIDPIFSPGDIVVPHDVIDETKHRKSTFYENTGLGFIRQNPVFCPHLRYAIVHQGNCKNGAIYVCTEGPRLETAAEIRKFAIYGGQLVGMTLVPECFLARELEMCYAMVCYVTNYAEGIRLRENRPGELFEGLLDPDEKLKVSSAVPLVAQKALSALLSVADEPRTCDCGKSMERFRKAGRIGDDWREWFQPQKRL